MILIFPRSLPSGVFCCGEKQELIDGCPSAVYNKMVSAVFSMDRSGHSSRTLDAGPNRASIARPIELAAGDTVREALLQGLFGSLRHILANLDIVRQQICPEAVHQLRVAARRLRVLLSVFQKVLDRKERLYLSGELKWLEQELGPAREWDVLIEEILTPRTQRERLGQGNARLLELANRHRTAAHEAARSAVQSHRLETLLQWFEQLLVLLAGEGESDAAYLPADRSKQKKQLGQPVRRLARKTLQARHTKAQTLKKKILRLDDIELHQMRIQLRKLRYTAELFSSLWRQKKTRETADRYISCLKKLQSVLGAVHDSAVAVRLMESIRAEAGPEMERTIGGILAHIADGHKRDHLQLAGQWRQFTRITKFWEAE